jgi:hypothetical protein
VCQGDDADPQQLVLKEAYQSSDPGLLFIRVEAAPGSTDLPVRWRTARESYFVTHPDRPSALLQLSPLDGPLDLVHDGVRTRDRAREWIGPPWQGDSLANDYLVLRPSAPQVTKFTPQVLVFSDLASKLDSFFSGARGNTTHLLPHISLHEMTEPQKEAFWQTVVSGDYALEFLPDDRRTLHSFAFVTPEGTPARLIVDVPKPTISRVGARIRVETGHSVKTYAVDRSSEDGSEYYTETCGVLRSGKDYGARLKIHADGTADWYVDRYSPPTPLTADSLPVLADTDGSTTLYTLDSAILDTPIIKRPRRSKAPIKPAPDFIAYGNSQGLVFLQLRAENSPARELLAPLNNAAQYFMGTRQEIMQVFLSGLSSTSQGWDKLDVSASFRMPELPGRDLEACWVPEEMTWELDGLKTTLTRLSPKEEVELVEQVKVGSLKVKAISRNYRTPLALARTYGANPAYFYWDNAANGTIDYRFFVGTKGNMSFIDDDSIGEYHHARDGGTLILEADSGLKVFLHTPKGSPFLRADKLFNLPVSTIKAGRSYLRFSDSDALKPLNVQRSPSTKQISKLLTPVQLGRLEPPPSPCAAILKALDQ